MYSLLKYKYNNNTNKYLYIFHSYKIKMLYTIYLVHFELSVAMDYDLYLLLFSYKLRERF